MNCELRGSRIFHRYHQQQSHRGEDRDREWDGKDNLLASTMMRAYPQSTKSIGSRTMITTSHVVDDLTLGYYPSPGYRFTKERNPKEYEASPASSRSFRIVSLDGCYEEQVSPLLTDSSSSISSTKIRNLPMIPAPPRCVMAKRESNAMRTEKKAVERSMAPSPINDDGSIQKEETNKITPPLGNMRRRRTSHNRSQFVFDGNISFGAVTPTHMYVATSPVLAYSSPLGDSYLGAMRISYPPMASPMSISPIASAVMPMPITPMSPISPSSIALFGNKSNHRKQQEQEQQKQKKLQQQKQGRKTPPPTPEEQRRRNRAMPSAQYEDLVLNQLRQEQLTNHEI